MRLSPILHKILRAIGAIEIPYRLKTLRIPTLSIAVWVVSLFLLYSNLWILDWSTPEDSGLVGGFAPLGKAVLLFFWMIFIAIASVPLIRATPKSDNRLQSLTILFERELIAYTSSAFIIIMSFIYLASKFNLTSFEDLLLLAVPAALIALRPLAIVYRVRIQYFGGEATEAAEVIDFILRNKSNFDDGPPKRIYQRESVTVEGAIFGERGAAESPR